MLMVRSPCSPTPNDAKNNSGTTIDLPSCFQSLCCILDTLKTGVYPSSRGPRKVEDTFQQGEQ